MLVRHCRRLFPRIRWYEALSYQKWMRLIFMDFFTITLIILTRIKIKHSGTNIETLGRGFFKTSKIFENNKEWKKLERFFPQFSAESQTLKVISSMNRAIFPWVPTSIFITLLSKKSNCLKQLEISEVLVLRKPPLIRKPPFHSKGGFLVTPIPAGGGFFTWKQTLWNALFSSKNWKTCKIFRLRR